MVSISFLNSDTWKKSPGYFAYSCGVRSSPQLRSHPGASHTVAEVAEARGCMCQGNNLSSSHCQGLSQGTFTECYSLVFSGTQHQGREEPPGWAFLPGLWYHHQGGTPSLLSFHLL